MSIQSENNNVNIRLIESGHTNTSSIALLNSADSDGSDGLKPFSFELKKKNVFKNSMFFV